MSKRLFALLLAVLILLTGCHPSATGQKGGDPVNGGTDIAGSLTVYCSLDYQAALDRVFRSVQTTYPRVTVTWTDEQAQADVMITDRLTPEQAAACGDLSALAASLSVSDALLLQSDGKVVGLPLFMRLDSFWYNQLSFTDESPAPTTLTAAATVLCAADEAETLFWSVVAPLYLANGGMAAEVATGSFRSKPLLAGLQRLELLCTQQKLVACADADDEFTNRDGAFWATGVYRIADIRNSISSSSAVSLMPSLASYDSEPVNLLLRADVVAVKQSADPALTTAFLQELFTDSNLINLATSAKVPPAARISYGSHSIQETFDPIYEELASPSIALTELICQWDDQTDAAVGNVMAAMLRGELTAAEACDRLAS